MFQYFHQATSKPGVSVAKCLDRASRIAVILVIVALTVFILRSFREVVSNPTDQAALSTVALLPQDSLEVLLDGKWQLEGMPFQIGVRSIDAAGIETAQAKLHDPPRDNEEDRPLDDMDRATWAFVELLSPTQLVTGAESQTVAYAVQRDGWQVIAFAPKSEPKQLQSIRLLQSASDENWNWIEVQRESQATSERIQASSHLLPMVDACKVVARRIDGAGKLSAELIETNVDFTRLESGWIAAGWDLSDGKMATTTPFNLLAGLESQKSLFGISSQGITSLPANEASDAALGQSVSLCRRGGETIYAIASQKLNAGTRTLLLLRVSSIAGDR